MASEQEVKKYLAYWFQLGKKIIIPSQNACLLPSKIIVGDRYSTEFEECWMLINQEKNQDSYLEGTIQTIQELLSSKWDITSCARCIMPVPMIRMGLQSNGNGCVCSDVEGWPNTELPPPHSPIDNNTKLNQIRNSLAKQTLLNKNPRSSDNIQNKTNHLEENNLPLTEKVID